MTGRDATTPPSERPAGRASRRGGGGGARAGEAGGVGRAGDDDHGGGDDHPAGDHVDVTSTSTSTSSTTTTTLAAEPPGFADMVRSALTDPRFRERHRRPGGVGGGGRHGGDHNTDVAMRPGSNEKLLVAWGAYGAIGPDARLTTEVRRGAGLDGASRPPVRRPGVGAGRRQPRPAQRPRVRRPAGAGNPGEVPGRPPAPRRHGRRRRTPRGRTGPLRCASWRRGPAWRSPAGPPTGRASAVTTPALGWKGRVPGRRP